MENNEDFEIKQEIENINNAFSQANSKEQKTSIFKKWWFWVIISVLATALIVGVTGNSGDNFGIGNCSHNYVLESREATCTSGGYDTYKCTLCSKITRKYKSSLGHTTSEGVCSRCGKSFGNWEISFYVDEFKNPTNDAYINNNKYFVGTFNNSVTADSKLYANILIDTEGVFIKLWEYGSIEVKAYTNTDYKITILDDTNTKHYTTGTMYENEERIFLKDWSLVNLLQSNSQVKIYIQEDSKYGYNSTYLFTVANGNFNSIYSDFYSNYIN